MIITLAVPCYNVAETLEPVLAGVAAQTVSPDEVLVVDDGSTDGSAALARRLGVRVVPHPGNLGLARARNTALEQSRGEVVVFVDADAVPRPDLVDRLTRGYVDPSLAGVSGQIMEPAMGSLADRWRGHFWRQTQGEAPLPRATFMVGGCCSLRREAALAVGAFTPGYRTNGEDVDLSLRLRQAGKRLAYDPAAQVLHLRRDSVASLLRMVYRHSRDHVRALRTRGESPAEVVQNAVRWGPVTVVSSLRRHRSAGLAALSLPCHAASLAGCAAGLVKD